MTVGLCEGGADSRREVAPKDWSGGRVAALWVEEGLVLRDETDERGLSVVGGTGVDERDCCGSWTCIGITSGRKLSLGGVCVLLDEDT